MLIQNFQEYFKKLFSGQQSKKIKILSTLSIGWIILIGYLVWWNGLKSLSLD